MFERLEIQEIFVYTPKTFIDSRGVFIETFNKAVMDPMTGPLDWVQDNFSRSALAGTVRGLHFQCPPFAQDKIVRCIRGAITDVVVDIRHGSPSFGKHVAVDLSEENGLQVFVPKGFAHGFITRNANSEVVYKVSAHYKAGADRGVRFDDPALAIDWGVASDQAILSDKDGSLPLLAETPVYFRYA